jgi:hypothetical protein
MADRAVAVQIGLDRCPRILSTAVLAVLLAFVSHHVLAVMNGDDLRRSILADLYVLDGKPHWRVFQNRLLGPVLVRTLMGAAPAPDLGYVLFDLICFGAALFLAGYLGLRVIPNRAGTVTAMLVLAVGLTALFAHHWFFAWDVVGPVLFMTFALLVVTEAKLVWFVALFAVAIWNRDDALFIALFLIVQPIVDWWRNRASARHFAWGTVVAGLSCLVCGMVLIEVLREVLLVEETGPRMFGFTPERTELFHWALAGNLDYLIHHMPPGAMNLPAYVLLPPAIIAAACLWLTRAKGEMFVAYGLVGLAMAAATLVFGNIREVRIWVDLLPPVVVATMLALARADQAGSGQRSRYG